MLWRIYLYMHHMKHTQYASDVVRKRAELANWRPFP